jgi:hypothetical protein
MVQPVPGLLDSVILGIYDPVEPVGLGRDQQCELA